MKNSSDSDDSKFKKCDAELSDINVDQLLMDSIPHPAMIINKNKVVLAANKVALSAGVKIGEYCWKEFGKCEYLSKETKTLAEKNPDADGIMCTFCLADHALHKKILTNDPEVSAFDRIWDTYWVPIKDDLYLHYAIDVTDKKRAEQSIIETERFRAIGEVAEGVAHDFNNALQGILGGIDLALEENIPLEASEELAIAKQMAIDVAARIKQLQRFAAKGKENKEDFVNIKLGDVIKDALLQANLLIGKISQERGIKIETMYSSCDNDIVQGNSGELRTVFFNIIKNSIEAMPNGGVIKIDVEKHSSNVIVLVVDNGVGMDEETKKRIFQPFYSTKGFEQGRGFGMSNAFAIIQEHDGNISVTNSLSNKGTTMKISLPYKANEGIFNDEARIERQGSIRVLWVDDEEAIRRFAGKVLQKLEHQIDVADGGREALELLEKTSYDLMITDIGMPEMNGWQLIDKIEGKYPNMQIATLTGWGDSISPEKKQKHNVDYFETKPIAILSLKKLIDKVLQKKNHIEG